MTAHGAGEPGSPADWRTNGVRVVPPDGLDPNTPQTPGMQRAAAVGARTGALGLWAGTVTVEPDARTGTHSHGELESVIYVVRGRARMRWGDALEFTAEAGPGSFVFVPPHVPHQEINASADEPLHCVVVRDGQDPVVVALDVEVSTTPSRCPGWTPLHPRARAGLSAVRTWLTERFGLRVPVVGAPMAGVSTGALAAAVSSAGGLGMIAVSPATTPERLRRTARPPGQAARSASACWRGRCPTAARRSSRRSSRRRRPSSRSATGRTHRWLRPLQEQGIVVATQVGTLAEALAASGPASTCSSCAAGRAAATGATTWRRCRCCRACSTRSTLPGARRRRRRHRPRPGGRAGGGRRRGVGRHRVPGLPGGGHLARPRATGCSLPTTPTPRTAGSSTSGSASPGRPSTAGGRCATPFFDRWAGAEDELATDDEAAEELREARARGDFDVACIYAGQGVQLLRAERSAADVVAELGRRRGAARPSRRTRRGQGRRTGLSAAGCR